MERFEDGEKKMERRQGLEREIRREGKFVTLYGRGREFDL